jgi:hypothetical protein
MLLAVLLLLAGPAFADFSICVDSANWSVCWGDDTVTKGLDTNTETVEKPYNVTGEITQTETKKSEAFDGFSTAKHEGTDYWGLESNKIHLVEVGWRKS